MFAGVVGGFELHRACPGLTLVTRERGIVGNLIASFGSGIERVGLEDPVFERRFGSMAAIRFGVGPSSPRRCSSGWSGSTRCRTRAASAARSSVNAW